MKVSGTDKAVCPSPSQQCVYMEFHRVQKHAVYDSFKTASFREFKLDNLSAHRLSLFSCSTNVTHHTTNRFHHWVCCDCTLQELPVLLYLLSDCSSSSPRFCGCSFLVCVGEDLLETIVVLPHLYHIKLGDAVLLHTHGHGDAVLLDEHGEAWRRGKGGSGRRLTREQGREG